MPGVFQTLVPTRFGGLGTPAERVSPCMANKNTTSTMTDPLRILRADHREAEQLLTRLSDSEEGAERESMIQELSEKLSLHMQLEEQMLYPLIAQCVGAEDEEEANIEHGLAREGLEKMTSMSTVPGFGAAVEMLKGGILHHVEEEEKEILPALRDAMDRDEWRALGEQLVAAKEAAGQPVKSSSSNGRRSGKRKKAA